jgi:hypothetical protein
MSTIDEKYDSLLYSGLNLGAPLTDETLLADGAGTSRDYENGSIYYHPDLGAYEVQGAILGRYRELGAEQSSLGYPVSDEEDYYVNEACAGRQNEFNSGVITWTPTDGPIEIYGSDDTSSQPEDHNSDQTSSGDASYQPEEQQYSDQTSSGDASYQPEEQQYSDQTSSGDGSYQPEEQQYTDDSTQSQEATGDIDTWLSLDYPARQLTVSQALQVVDYLISQGDAGLQLASNAVDQANVTKMQTGNGETKKVVKAYRIKPDIINGIQFKYLVSPTNAKVVGFLDNVDPRMIVFLYKMTTWLRDTWGPDNYCTVTEVHHIGIGHGNPAHLFDCHNTGRALDLGGISGTTSDGSTFTLSIVNDWGKKPPVVIDGKTCFRLSESDGLIYSFARGFYEFCMQHCQDISKGSDELLSADEVYERTLEQGRETVKSFICHPDHPDPNLRKSHYNHFHVQVGTTGYEAAPAL